MANLKALYEKRAELYTEMNKLVSTADTENRAMTTEEMTRFDQTEQEIKNIDGTIQREERARNIEKKEPAKTEVEERAVAEERAFANFVRGVVEERTDVNMTVGDNGAVIPSSIANRIIETVVEICPIYQLSERFDVSGTLNIPKYDESTQEITCTYATEFTDLTSSSGKFASVELKGFLAGALSKVSKSLINNSNFQLVNFVIKKIAEAVSKWIEGELLYGTTDKIAGLSGVTQNITAAKTTEVTCDELIDVQELVPDIYQEGAIWIMSRATRKAIRKLKDGNGQYLLNKDATAKWGYTLLGKDVYTSAKMEDMSAGKVSIYYGDMTGLATKVSENISVEVLRELFAAQHALGVVAWVEMDSKVQNVQKIGKLTMHA